MGKRGPQKTPTQTLRLRGSWRAGERDGEPELEPTHPKPPKWLSDAAKEHWDSLCPQAYGMMVMHDSHATALAILCESLANYIMLRDAVSEKGCTMTSDKGNVLSSPLVTQRDRAWDQVLKGLREFGMTPAALTSVRAVDEGNPKDRGKERYFA